MPRLSFYLKKPANIGIALLMHYGKWLPDNLFLKLLFRMKMGYKLNLKSPKTFAEKLQWLKINDRKPIYHQMVDKVDSKTLINSMLHGDYTVPTLGVYDSFDQIDWDSLPQQFILKATHDSGSFYIVRDKNKVDKQQCKKQLYFHWNEELFKYTREWQYKGLKSRIIAEPLIAKPESLREFKFFCFNGKPKFFQSIMDRDSSKGGPILQHFDINGKRMDMQDANYESRQGYDLDDVIPRSLDKMKEISECLSKDTFFIRVDFYETDDKLYVGELTLHDSAGFCSFKPNQWNYTLGEWINLPMDNLKQKKSI